MNPEMFLTAAQLMVMLLSFMFLLRARRLSVELWATRTSYWREPTGSLVEQPSEFDLIFRA
jgi:hypothetical protein